MLHWLQYAGAGSSSRQTNTNAGSFIKLCIVQLHLHYVPLFEVARWKRTTFRCSYWALPTTTTLANLTQDTLKPGDVVKSPPASPRTGWRRDGPTPTRTASEGTRQLVQQGQNEGHEGLQRGGVGQVLCLQRSRRDAGRQKQLCRLRQGIAEFRDGGGGGTASSGPPPARWRLLRSHVVPLRSRHHYQAGL